MTSSDPLIIHAGHTILDFRRAHEGETFVSPEAEWRAYVAFQSTALLRITGNGKYHLELTISQRMALLTMIGEVLACTCPHAEEFIDCSSATETKTTPGDHLKLVMEATFMERV